MKAREVVIALWLKNGKSWEKTYDSICKKEDIDVEYYLRDVDVSKYVTILDSDYPQELKYVYKPPFVLEK